MRRLLVSGVALRGSGYPNAERTLALLRASGRWDIDDQADWLPENLHLWRVARGPWLSRIAVLLRLLLGTAVGVVRSAWTARGAPVYLPYPALFALWWAALIPRRWRPHYIADAYISIWDSMFRDRGQGRSDGIASRLLQRFEGRALRAAAVVLTDTEANRAHLIRDFRLSPQRVRSLPLAIDEARFCAIAPARAVGSSPLRVLFVGTLIPLHGIGVLLDTLRALAADPRFEFRLIGSGQLSSEVERFVQAHALPQLTWIREWCGLDRIAAEIAAADICLGVFGGSGKAARVLPFKLYMYLAAGRAVITQAGLSVPADVPYPPIETVDSAAPEALATAIVRLAEDPQRRLQLAQAGRDYYLRWLANARIAEAWDTL